MDINKLRAYAKLIVHSGINVQPGEPVILRCAPEQLNFVEMVTEECYLAGAKEVTVDFRWQPLTKLHIQHQDVETLGCVEKWEEEKLKHYSETLPSLIYLTSEDPDGLKGIDTAKKAQADRASYAVTKKYSDAMENKYKWCIAAVPGKKWAEKMFPELGEAEAEEKLWHAILSCSRADTDPEKAWAEHNANLARRCSWLNSLKLRRLVYKSESTGTDFSVGLIPDALFVGGAEKLPGSDIWYNPNIPSEEVFISPMAGDAEGIVYSTKPLSYRGLLIEDFSVKFEKGRATEVKARCNEEALRVMVSMDEGAAMLGECALVPHNSPISRSGLLFYNTLFDENASCHLALGAGFSSCLENYEQYSLEQAREKGINDSMIHEDFMIGCEDLSITGITEDGRQVAIFVNGDWAQD